ncbi:DUF4157 domain-containing protein [Burkholderia sp. Bp8963]|uniref:eCIS core domain-containing protein n=1 Tax=Burkholderia sp. Bp8963 TaxID=2184547 RepID=UPI000F59F70D|nr:DUF4157 domain-containing protein [Burkholderia sp. Bp8963]RQS65773.1 DUF4157 domain-containing protein [Burkholderia sp. Bp8963]
MGATNATAEKTSTTTSATRAQAQAPGRQFFSRAGGGDFFPRVQTKMTVGQPGDKFEQEADHTADKVMRMATPSVAGGAEKLQRQPDDKIRKAPAEEPKIRRREEEKIFRAASPDDKIRKAPAEEPKIQRREEEKILRAAAGEGKLQKVEAPRVRKMDGPHRDEEKILRAADDKLQKADANELQRDAAPGGGTPSVTSNVQSGIHGRMTGGEPLAADVRGYMEPRFDADFANVRVHHDAEAGKLSNQLGARAFTYRNHIFFSRGEYQPGTSDGKHLLAHELTHTIQQGHSVQRAPQISTTASPSTVQCLGKQDALDKFAEWAYAIPGFRLLTLILGFNPISMRSADRTAANILRALIELMPGGSFITRALDNHGIINKAAAWVEAKLSELGDIGSELSTALKSFLDSLSWKDIFDLDGVWERAKRIFTDPIERLKNFAISTALELLKIVKDAILKPLAVLAQGTRGYDLLCVLLGADPISGEPAPPTADNLLGGFMKLIGEEEIWQNIKKGNAIARAFAWFQNAAGGLKSIMQAIPKKIIDTIKSLTFMDVVTVVGAFGKIVGAFVDIAGDFIRWGLTTIWELLKIIFDVVKPGLMGYIQRTGGAINSILKNPMPFLHNLVAAAKLGFTNFAANFGTHLKGGLIEWLTGSLQGVYIPKAMTLIELGKFALSVLGITWQQIRGKIVAALGPNGERIMQGLETAFDVVMALVRGGVAAVWDLIKEKLADLKDQVVSGIISFVTDTIVKKAIPKLIGMFIPGAGFIPAIISIYDTIMVFVQKLTKIFQVVSAFIDSIVAIAAGNIGGAAKRVESVLAGLLSLAISFLAGFLGLSKVTDKIMEVVQKVRAKVDAAIGAAVNWVVGKAKALFASLFSKNGKPDDRTDEQRETDKKSALAEAEALVPSPDDFDEDRIYGKLGAIKSRYRLTALELVVESETESEELFHFEAAASPNTPGHHLKGKKGKPIGSLGVKRSMLGWEQPTLDHFLKDPIWNKIESTSGDYKSAKIDIRHKVSISDTIANTDKVLGKMTVSEAAKELRGKTVDGKNFAPPEPVKGKPGIVVAARQYLQAANNDLSNLFLGDASVNRSLGKKYDTGWAGSDDDPSKQQQEYADKWGFKVEDEYFSITIERQSRRRGTSNVTKDLTPT